MSLSTFVEAPKGADMIQAVKATFNDETGDREPTARAASAIVLAVFGVLIPPFTLLVMDHVEPGPGSIMLLILWAVLSIGAYVPVENEPPVAAPAQGEEVLSTGAYVPVENEPPVEAPAQGED
jgi:protein-S-isoprenylcysteine O-methyltransferase Ste14